MEAKDLRIGNLVRIAGGDYEVEVLNVTNSIFLSSMGAQDIKDVKPIPITEEWLLKFGFVKEDDNYELKQVRINLNNQTTKIGAGWIGIDINHCKHVHQLQNLYFALTGEELNLNF